MKLPVVLFDADGVLTLPEEVFSVVYARSHGLDTEPFERFFKIDWPAIVTGKKDLKESVAENSDLWQWHGSIDALLDYWFKTEDVRNEELLQVVSDLRAAGIPCYLATDQEKYRSEYMQNTMFKDCFDGFFISATLGVTKTNPEFFKLIIEQLKLKYPGIEPNDIIFFDDSQSKIDTARSCGINGQLFSSVEQVREVLDEA